MAYTKDRSIYVSKRFFDYQDSDGTVSGGLRGTSVLLSRSRTGVSCPNYRDRIRRQQNATTDMSGTYDTYVCTPGQWYSVRQDNNFGPSNRRDHLIRARVSGDLAGASSPISWWTPTITTAVAHNRALIAFLKKGRAIQREFSSPIFLGELRETVRMIRRPAVGLRRILDSYLKDVSKLKKKNPKNWKKNLSDTWLENAFGWQPLAHDLADAYKAYQSRVLSDEQREVSAIGIEEKFIPAQSSYNYTGGFPAGATTTYLSKRTKRATEKAFVKFHGMVVRRVDGTTRDKLARIGFEPNEFLPTAWELLPWSFLVDYFSNIGDVIESSAFSRSLLSWSSSAVVTSQKIEYTASSSVQDIMKQPQFGPWLETATFQPVSFVAERRVVRRSANATLGTPDFALELPGSPFQYANMLALFTSANSIHPQSYKGRLR